MNNAFNKIIKTNVVLACLSVIAVILLVTGASYALFEKEDVNTENQVISIGTLDAEITSKTGAIKISNIYPSKYEELKENENVYEFSIANTGDYLLSYEVNLRDSTEKFLNNCKITNDCDEYKGFTALNQEYLSFINYKLDAGETQNLGDIYTEGKQVLLLGILAKGASEDHRIQFWLDENAPNSVIEKVLSLDIYLDATAIDSPIIAHAESLIPKQKFL